MYSSILFCKQSKEARTSNAYSLITFPHFLIPLKYTTCDFFFWLFPCNSTDIDSYIGLIDITNNEREDIGVVGVQASDSN